MQSTKIVLLAAFLGLWVAPATSFAQRTRPKKVAITDVRVGYKSGFDQGDMPEPNNKWQYLFKAGAWTPVFVDIEAGDEPFTEASLVVETTDSDDVQNNYTLVRLPAIGSRESYTALAFTKPGSVGSEIIVRISNRNNNEEFTHKKVYDAVELHDLIFLAAGSHLTGLKQSLAAELKQAEGAIPQNPNVLSGMNHGRVSYIDSATVLPTRWFAYQPVDLMIISTARADFTNELMSRENKSRLDALSEWVRRGGRLVIAAGKNHDLAAALLVSLNMQSLAIEFMPGGMQLQRLVPVERWVAGQQSALENTLTKAGEKTPPPIEAAKLRIKPGQETDVIIPGPANFPNNPLMVRAAFGMGQVAIVAFDLDQPPFTRWTGQSDYWRKFRSEFGTSLMKVGQQANFQGGRTFMQNEDNDLAGMLRTSLETFPDVSNISFGWVALFIFIYILVVGPLDYFFLKKVVKRLELTWITFPTVVLVVSTVSYFTAYALKGNDLLINKTDLVDIDQTGNAVYCHSWFTLFSPRIQHYTIGIEPAAPTWAAMPADDNKASSVVVSWMGRPDASYGGFGRARSQSLFRRAYNYAPDAAGLEGVPIQVWSSKSFTASWDRPLPDGKPLFKADIKHVKGPQRFEGTITNLLPVPLEGAYIIYGGGATKGTVYVLDKPLMPNVPFPINLSNPKHITEWPGTLPSPAAFNRGNQTPQVNKEELFKRMVFHQVYPNTGQAQNVSHRDLDESWRLRLKNEIIVFGRIAPITEPASAANKNPGMPSRLWLGKLPSPGVERPELLGTITQDTYVRVFLPVKGDADGGENGQ